MVMRSMCIPGFASQAFTQNLWTDSLRWQPYKVTVNPNNVELSVTEGDFDISPDSRRIA